MPAGCAYSQDGKPQAGMGVAVGDYDRNGTMDIFKTNFAGDTSTLYSNTGDGFCEDRTFAGGIGVNTRWLGWGAGFVDLDNDGWLDLFLVNGHVYPEVGQLQTEAGYKQRKVVYRNLRQRALRGRHASGWGRPRPTPKAGRGAAFGDFDNDGDVDVVINNVHDAPDLFRRDADPAHHWLTVKLVGTRSNRSAIGARVRCTCGRGDAGAGGARRRQLHLAERPARALRPGRRRRGGAARGALAERPGGGVAGPGGGPDPHLREGTGTRTAGESEQAAACVTVAAHVARARPGARRRRRAGRAGPRPWRPSSPRRGP